jgi:hypothetical protein
MFNMNLQKLIKKISKFRTSLSYMYIYKLHVCTEIVTTAWVMLASLMLPYYDFVSTVAACFSWHLFSIVCIWKPPKVQNWFCCHCSLTYVAPEPPVKMCLLRTLTTSQLFQIYNKLFHREKTAEPCMNLNPV